jgi:hypothetical protein
LFSSWICYHLKKSSIFNIHIFSHHGYVIFMEAPAAPQEGLLNQWRSDIEASGVVVSSRWGWVKTL